MSFKLSFKWRSGTHHAVQIASKYQKNSKKQKAPKQAIKEASKKAKRDKVRIGVPCTHFASLLISLS